jgi:hypothetical protein
MAEMDQKTLKKFIARRHPEYDKRLVHWMFLESTYEGGRDWFEKNIFRYIKEGDKEFTDRLARAYRFNHTREVVDLVDKYIFKMEISRKKDDAPESVNKFWKSATLNNVGITDFMKQVSKMTSIKGRNYIVVDTNKTDGVETRADEVEQNIRTYVYLVKPESVLDMSYDEEGRLNWILIHEQVRDDSDPFEGTGELIDRFRLWQRDTWTLFTIKYNGKAKGGQYVTTHLSPSQVALRIAEMAKTGKTGDLGTIAPSGRKGGFTIEVDGPHEHGLGEVPVIPVDNVISTEPYSSPSLIDDVAYLDRAVANYMSNLDAIVQDQTFSQLIMPAQGFTPGEDEHDKLVAMGTKRIFTYDATGGGKPEYIGPDVKQAELILKIVNKIINEIYHSVGLAGERTKEDNALGIDNSSGVAKAYDFERVNSLLAAKADSLELIENRIVRLVLKWNGEGEPKENLVSYPDNFDVRGLYDEFEIAARLALVEAPDSMRQEQMKIVVEKLFPRLKRELKEKIVKEIEDNWPPKIVDPATGDDQGGGVDAITAAANNSLANKLVK